MLMDFSPLVCNLHFQTGSQWFLQVQGMTIRTAQLPGGGNVLGQAGEDLSGLHDRARRCHFFIYFLLTIQAPDFESL